MYTREYWERRLANFCNLEGVGCLGLGRSPNSYIYKAKVRTLERASKELSLPFKDKEILDVGSGIGFWIDYYLGKGAKLVYGVDLAEVAIKYLNEKYSGYDNIKLLKSDFACLTVKRRFDIVNAFDVAYHVVNDELFVRFVENLCKHLKDGGYLLIRDTFREDYYPIPPTTYVKFRSLNTYREILNGAKVEMISLYPMYSILSWPYTGNRDLDGCFTFAYNISLLLYSIFPSFL
jgi:SAM-dependent methyltransferase